VVHISQDNDGMLWLSPVEASTGWTPGRVGRPDFGTVPDDPGSLSSDNIESTASIEPGVLGRDK